MNTLMICILIVSLYIGIESWLPICKMESGLKDMCHKTKYGVAVMSALAYAAYALGEMFGMPYIQPATDWLVFGSVGSIALFVWPRTLYRLKVWHGHFAFRWQGRPKLEFKDRLEKFFKTGEWIR